MRSRKLAFLAVVLVAVGTGAGLAAPVYADTSSTPAQGNGPVDEARFLDLANQVRVSQGAPALQPESGLTSIARWWAANMAGAGDIFHNRQLPQDVTDAVTPSWYEVAENVGVGPSVDSLHKAFVNSPHHYENLVNPGLTYVGIGVTYDDNGRIYVVFDFMELQPPAPPPAPTPEPRPVAVRTVPAPRVVEPAPRVPVPVPVTAPPARVVALPSPPAVTLSPGRSLTPAAGVSVVLPQLRQLDLTLRPRKAASAAIVRPRHSSQATLAPPLTVQHDDGSGGTQSDPPVGTHEMTTKLWLPPSYCEGPNKLRSRMC